MSLAHGNPLRRPIPHGEYESRWLSPECRLVGSDPHKHAFHEKWEKSNRLSLLLMQAHVGKNIRGSIPVCTTAKNFMKAIEDQFVSFDKAKASTLMSKMASMKYSGSGSIREHIMEMKDIAFQLNEMEFTISETFLVHFILNSLPAKYGPFKISYNTQKEKWSINDLLSMCVQEEERIKGENVQSAHLVSHHTSKVGKASSHLPPVAALTSAAAAAAVGLGYRRCQTHLAGCRRCHAHLARCHLCSHDHLGRRRRPSPLSPLALRWPKKGSPISLLQ
uniref:Retrovirus-related Pol polyprotein from transposon TNT 1-94 n=1 Tax=Ananas comosus var. bracteatus TaxID=296719 RepID=A0A6V7NF84_ANACO|nr:unnamed protein product [Ananas comosus var. bracteatus]